MANELQQTMTKYDSNSLKEDVSAIIHNLDPDETPCLSNAGRRDVNNTLFEWQTENLPTSASTNARVEGSNILGNGDNELDAGTATSRQSNYCQISFRNASVSGTLDSLSQYGKARELSHQLALRSKQLKIDIEKTILSHNPAVVGTSTAYNDATARQTESLPHQIARFASTIGGAVVKDSGTTLPTATQTTTAFTETSTAAASLTVLSEGTAMGVAQAMWDNGANLDTILVNGAMKREISDFTGRSGTQVIVDPNKVTNNITLVATDFGDVKVMMDRHMFSNNGVDVGFIDWDYVKIAFLRPFTRQPLAKQGDSTVENIICEWGIEMSNAQALGWMFAQNQPYAS